MRVMTEDVATAQSPVALLVALPEEAAPLLSRIRREAVDGDPRHRHRGVFGSRAVALQVTGPGPARAARAAHSLLESVRPMACICVGLAGALSPAMQRGDLVLATHVVDPSGAESIAADPWLLDVARRAYDGSRPLHEAALLTSPRVVGTAAEKAALAATAGAVDMESLAVARVAAAADIPFLAVRIISDTATEEFPIDLNQYIDDKGNVKRLQLALAALGKPTAVPFLLRMRRAAADGGDALASYLESLVNLCPRRFSP